MYIEEYLYGHAFNHLPKSERKLLLNKNELKKLHKEVQNVGLTIVPLRLFLTEKGCRIMDFTKRPMKGYLYISPEGIDMDDDLDKWIIRCLEFNPKAKSSKKRNKKSH